MKDVRIEGWGVTQTRLTRHDLELTRQWRNDPAISQFMFFRGHITPQMQEAWFESVDNEENYYFVVHHDGRPVGLNYIKEIDWSTRTGQGGIFIVPQELRNSLFVFRVAIPALDWIFGPLGLERVKAVVVKSNTRAVRYNLALGHTLDPSPPGSDRVTSSITRDAYWKRRPMFDRMFGP